MEQRENGHDGSDQDNARRPVAPESRQPMDFTSNYAPVDHYSMLDYYEDRKVQTFR